MMSIGRQLVPLAAVAFALNVIWENAQAPLFAGYASFSRHFPICLWGTIGDVAIIVSVYALVGLLKSDYRWIMKLNRKDIAALAVMGFFTAVAIEHRALLLGRWAYAPLMPIIPYLRVGLAPVLQMTLLLPFTVYVTKKTTRYP